MQASYTPSHRPKIHLDALALLPEPPDRAPARHNLSTDFPYTMGTDKLSKIEGLWRRVLTSGSALEVKNVVSQVESGLSPAELRSPINRTLLRTTAVRAASAGNMDVMKYLCGERRVPVNFVPMDEFSDDFAGAHFHTPLSRALHMRDEDMALYLLSLAREEDSTPLNLDMRVAYKDFPLLTMAADLGMMRVVKALLALGADLLARDSEGHLPVCRAVRKCHVEVVNVLLGAHAAQGGGDGSVEAVLDCPCKQDQINAYPLIFHAMDGDFGNTPEARLTMVRYLVQNWDLKLQAMTAVDGFLEVECHPFFMATMGTAQNMVDFFLDECGIDVNMALPRTQDTALHAFARHISTSKREVVRMLKYLVEERGADPTLKNACGQDARDVALENGNSICINYFSSLPGGDSTRVTDPTKLRRLEALERKRAEAKAAAEAASKATEAELTGIREEQEAKAEEAIAALLAELDAEEQTAAVAAAKK